MPRRLITPRTYSGACGKTVVLVQPRISRIDMMSAQNSWPEYKGDELAAAVVFDVVRVDHALPPAAMRWTVGLALRATADDQAVDIEDQRHAAVAQDCGRGNALDAA